MSAATAQNEIEVHNVRGKFEEKAAEKHEVSLRSLIIETECRVNCFLNQLDDYLRSYAPLNRISFLLGIRISLLFIGSCSIIILSLRNGWGHRLICDFCGILYPAWMTFKAIEFPHEGDPSYWLIHWLVYSFFVLLQYPLDLFFFWVPLYSPIKIFVTLWLYLPKFQGSKLIYSSCIRPFLLRNLSNIDGAVYSFKGAVGDAVGIANAAAIEKITGSLINPTSVDEADELDVPMEDEITPEKRCPRATL
ncbi:TB2/DP1, HVA22 family protein [Cardiosporidium cionae]|uniref:TB2/DP1, HVA22 family protein n=1 Tax=Cardiosporidium cionae TaxID=476202 RepID=A0ABQ7JFY7_9APIC|nr:TB2/DP1, HVA22 family protein [Cardiosporidium cionae]|eukprot:KAF8822897.1 TB2/DP1, HVA22 family protein [Cardiosporidium cionae]